MAKVLVVGVKSYSFKNQDGQNIEGAKVSYLTDTPSHKTNEIGYLPIQASIPLSMLKSFTTIPGIYEVKYDMIPGRNNKPEVTVAGFDLINEIDYLGLFKDE